VKTNPETARAVRDAADKLRDEATDIDIAACQAFVDALDDLTIGETARLYDMIKEAR
jgi:hypothetical protein